MFVGEAPGEQEDQRGRPFVGPAGELLDKIIGAMGLARDQVFITNSIKCRPPGNANPTPDQLLACEAFLARQIELVRPRVLVALGAIAAASLTGEPAGVARMRGRWLRWGDIPVAVTYHPAALLRDPGLKKLVWEDMQRVMARLKQEPDPVPRR
jgi:DNA polymerase